jgi:prepilin-type N-terminal cleavage/methylation domain-containing protein
MTCHFEHRGFSLIELMFALAILGVVSASMTTGFMQMARRNSEQEIRTSAIAAAQIVLDGIRVGDPSLLPADGTEEEEVTCGSRTFTIQTTYCAIQSYCTSNNIRQIRIGVIYRGKTRYQVDTVFSQLR